MRFLLLSTEEQVEDLIQYKYFGVKEMLKEKNPDKEYSVSDALDYFLETQWCDPYYKMTIPWESKKSARRAIKKDILCLVALTCDYWRHKKSESTKKWEKEEFGTNISKVRWKLDFGFLSHKGVVEINCFLAGLVYMVLQKPEIWNELSKAAKYKIFAPSNIIDSLYAKLSPEEMYVYQTMTGFSVAGTLYRSLEEMDEECVLAEAIGKIYGLYTRMYYAEALCKNKSVINKFGSLKKHKDVTDSMGELYAGLSQEGNFGRFNKMLMSESCNMPEPGNIINNQVLDLGRAFLRVLMIDLVNNESADDWAEIIWESMEKEFCFEEKGKLKEFWLDTKIRKVGRLKEEIEGDFTKDERCKNNLRFTQLMKVIMDTIILESGKSAVRMDFPPYFDMNQVVYCR